MSLKEMKSLFISLLSGSLKDPFPGKKREERAVSPVPSWSSMTQETRNLPFGGSCRPANKMQH